MHKLAVACLLTAATLSGCAVGPDYKRPEDPVVQLRQPAGFDNAKMERDWWGQFNDPTLNQLVNAALNSNHSLAAAKDRVQAAYALLADRRNDNLPKGDLGVDYSSSKAPVATAYDTRIKDEHFRTGASLSWELDLFGRIRRSVQMAEADAQASTASLRQVQVNMIAAVVSSYGDLRAAQQRVVVAQKNLANLKEVVKLTEFRFQNGSGSELDVSRTKAQYAGTEAELPPLQAQIERDMRQLEVLTGQTPGSLTTTLQLPAQLPAVNQPLHLGNLADLLRRRPDIQLAERHLASATASIGVATADLFPHVEMSGFLGFVSARGSQLTNSGSQAWSIAPSLSWPLFDLGSVEDRIDQSQYNADALLQDYRHTVLNALGETQNALTDYSHQQDQLRLLLEQENYSGKAQSLAQEQYRAGIISLLDVLDTERTKLAAEDAVVQAELGTYLGIVELYRSLGGGWEPEGA